MSRRQNRRSVASLSGDAFIVPDRMALLRALDLTRPALSPVKEALDRGDLPAAERAYCAHFRSRPMHSHGWAYDWTRLPRDPQYKNALAEDALRGRLSDGYCAYDVPSTGVDWRECPLSCLNRFDIFHPLLLSYYNTGETRYLRYVVDHSLAGMRAWPLQEFAGHTTQEGWRTHYVVAAPWYWCILPHRQDQWALALPLLRQSAAVTDDELLAILQRTISEIRFLLPFVGQHVANEHNSGCFMIRVLGEVSDVLSDFREAAGWRRLAARYFAQYLDAAWYPDGFNKELTMAYNLSMMEQMCKTGAIFIGEPALESRGDHLRRIMTAHAALTGPSGRVPSFGDLCARAMRGYLYEPMLAWAGLPWLRWLLGEAGAPEPPFTYCPPFGEPAYGGYYVMRSDWSEKARYLMIDGGPWGTSHQHGDKLSFALSAHGADFIVDPATTTYASNAPEAVISIMNAGFLHNTIVVDGVDEYMKSADDLVARAPLANRWEQLAQAVVFVGAFDFAPLKPVRWERRICFVDGAYWLLQDVLTGAADEVAVEQNFQFDEPIVVRLDGADTLATAPNGARLWVRPLAGALKPTIVSGDKTPRNTYSTQAYSPEEAGNPRPRWFAHGRGWVGRCTDRLLPAPAVTYVGRVRLPAIFTLALLPLAPGAGDEALPEIVRTPRADGDEWRLPTRSGALQWRTALD
ncbi:MAG: alginate lyase family protein [Lentisphaerae bacterium]|nr:alginate lyase family protein [Lentisphaerota bacterium]